MPQLDVNIIPTIFFNIYFLLIDFWYIWSFFLVLFYICNQSVFFILDSIEFGNRFFFEVYSSVSFDSWVSSSWSLDINTIFMVYSLFYVLLGSMFLDFSYIFFYSYFILLLLPLSF